MTNTIWRKDAFSSPASRHRPLAARSAPARPLGRPRYCGYVTGYRGSPLATYDLQLTRARKWLEAEGVRFQPGLNEDLALTSVWGSQQAEVRGDGRHDGVFALWYGKGAGVDRYR